MEETKKNQFHSIQQQEEEDDAKWVTHYSSYHEILLVGEGDFSFSLSLAKSFGSASNIVASSLNSYDDVIKMYKNAKSNLDDLHKLGACLLHGVDATKMKLHSDLKMRRFDRVIFNFPHAGFRGKEDNTLVIEMHKALVLGFFKNASGMLRANGEIHVSHKITDPYNEWRIVNLALQNSLKLIGCADFKREDYPGYNNKRGDGDRCDEPFPLRECCTFKFIINPEAKRQNHMKRNQMVASRQQACLPLQEIEVAVEQLPTSAHLNYYPQTSHFLKIEEVTSIFGLTNRFPSITGCHFPISLEARNESYQVYGGRPKYLQELGGTMHTVPLSPGARNEDSKVYGGRSNSFQELAGTTAHRASYPSEEGHTLRDEYLKWPTSTNAGYPMRDHVRSMESAPSSLGASNEGYFSNIYGGSSNYWQEEPDRTTALRARARARASYYFDGVRSDFERHIGQVHGRLFVQSDLHRMNILMQEREGCLLSPDHSYFEWKLK